MRAVTPPCRSCKLGIVAVRFRPLGSHIMAVEVADQFLGTFAPNHSDDRVELGLGPIVIFLRGR
jgi:hypothetical protein